MNDFLQGSVVSVLLLGAMAGALVVAVWQIARAQGTVALEGVLTADGIPGACLGNRLAVAS
ncbi:hypothetical protein ACWDWO_14995 [Actinopolymorpha singaporensis]|uniref:Uncharacterized protein n=1 Tax=Actinopolymorpha singaporensis TaxID=117157 RepID=A0A1H1UL88_9ACTN|nr:hypothetical protein [Actinopolymorpha singaporensis]SDS73090.1 hypothetical protein SAMN04489717_3674 [Actinopolymorpha singaporensis]